MYSKEQLKKLEGEISGINFGLELMSDRKELTEEIRNKRTRWNECFELIYNHCVEAQYYTEFSPKKIYETFYPERLIDYQTQFPDATELEFIEHELYNLEAWGGYIDRCFFEFDTSIDPPIEYPEVRPPDTSDLLNIISEENKKKLSFSIKRKIEFLLDKKNSVYAHSIFGVVEEQTSNKGEKSTQQEAHKIKWNGTAAELMELLKALYDNGNLKLTKGETTQKAVFEAFFNFLNYKVKDPANTINRIKTQRETPSLFIDKLSKIFTDFYFNKKN